MVRKSGAQGIDDRRLGIPVDLRNVVVVALALEFDFVEPPLTLHDDGARAARGAYCDVEHGVHATIRRLE